MARTLQLPGGLFWRVFAGVGTLVAGIGTWLALGSQLPNLDPAILERAAVVASFTNVRELERGWVAAPLFGDANLLAPVADPPCAGVVVTSSLGGQIDNALRSGNERELAELSTRNPESWLAALALANYYLREDQPVNAERALTRLYGQKSFRDRWARAGSSPAELVGQIHFFHALGYALLRNNAEPPSYFWDLVKLPIGKVKMLNEKGLSNLPIGTPTWRNHRVPSPGCSPSENDLTSFDLYNNLIVAYKLKDFKGSKRQKEIEFYRGYSDPPERNPLQHALRAAVTTELAKREPWVWALSNSERLLRERYQESAGPPENARLSLTLAQVAAEAYHLVGGEAREGLSRQIGELLESAEGYRGELEEEELAELDAGIARLRLLAAIGGNGTLTSGCASGLSDEQCKTFERVRLAVEGRSDPEKLTALIAGKPQPVAAVREALGENAGDWLSALREDLAEALARLGLASESPEERADLAWMARSTLPLGAATPEPLAQLVKSLGFSQRLGHALLSLPGRIILTVLATALAFIMLTWWSIQMLFRKALFTSFYRLEAQRKVRAR